MIPPLSPQTFFLLATHFSADQRHVWHLISFYTAHLKGAESVELQHSCTPRAPLWGIEPNLTFMITLVCFSQQHIAEYSDHQTQSTAVPLVYCFPWSSSVRHAPGLWTISSIFLNDWKAPAAKAKVKLVQTGPRVSRASAHHCRQKTAAD